MVVVLLRGGPPLVKAPGVFHDGALFTIESVKIHFVWQTFLGCKLFG
jgi:hypothetical protein